MPNARSGGKSSKTGNPKSKGAATQFFRRLGRLHIATLTLVILLTSLLHIVSISIVENREYDSHITSITHRQATLSQQITKTSLYTASAPNPFQATRHQEQLSRLLAEFQRNQLGLIHGDAALGLKAENSEQMLELFKKTDSHYQNMVTAAEAILAAHNDGGKTAGLLQRLQLNESNFLAGIHDIASVYEREAKQRTEWGRWLSYGLMAAIVIALTTGLYLVSSPAMRRIKHDLQKQANRENDLDNLFAASPGALLMVDMETFRILRGNQQLQELTSLPQSRLEGLSLHQLLDASYDTNRTFIDKLKRDRTLNEFEVVLMDVRHSVIESLASSRAIQYAGKPVMVLGFTNINQIKKTQRKLEYYATYDELTGLMNRRTGLAFLEKAMARAWRESSDLTVIYADLDGLKKANDRYGHAEGDRLIRAAANIITGLTRMSDCAVRLGGDEFLIILPSCSSQNAKRIANNLERLLMALKSDDDKKRALYSISCGITSYVPDRHGTPEELIAEADKKMYHVKQMRK